MASFNVWEVDSKLLAAFEALGKSPAGSLVFTMATDMLAAKGFPDGVKLPTGPELMDLARISDLQDQALIQNDVSIATNGIKSSDPGVKYLKAVLASGLFKTLKIVVPTMHDLISSRPDIVLKMYAKPGPPPAPSTVIEKRGQIIYERLPDANGTEKIVETDTVSKQTRDVVRGLASADVDRLLKMTSEKPSNVVVYEVWQDAATAPAAPTAPTIQDNVPPVGDFANVDPLMQELMKAQQDRIARGP